jgi:hypothetical protein
MPPICQTQWPTFDLRSRDDTSRGQFVVSQSRSKRWLGVLCKVQSVLQLAKRSVAAYEEAPTRMKGVRVISEPDQQCYDGYGARPIPALTADAYQGATWRFRAREVVPDVGHFLHIEAPEAIAERIAAWAQ